MCPYCKDNQCTILTDCPCSGDLQDCLSLDEAAEHAREREEDNRLAQYREENYE